MLIDALCYASGEIVERVEIGADKPYKIIEDEGKLVGTWRKTLWWMDATMVLHEFACREAEDALQDAGITDERCWDAIRIKRLWVQGKATDEELTKVRIAVANASTIGSVGRTAAFAAITSAISNISWTTSWDETRARQNRRLTAMVCAAHRKMGM